MFLGARARFQVFLLKKLCFSVLVLNSTEGNDSRFSRDKQFHFLVPILFCLEFKFKEKSFHFYRGQWVILIILPKASVFLRFHCL